MLLLVRYAHSAAITGVQINFIYLTFQVIALIDHNVVYYSTQ